jgi:hypothetical protein
MRLLLTLCLSLFALTAFAESINCYSADKLIYSGHGHDITYDDSFLVFKDNKSEKYVIIFASCVINLD